MEKNRNAFILLLLIALVALGGIVSFKIRKGADSKPTKNIPAQEAGDTVVVKKTDKSPYLTVYYEYPVSGPKHGLVKERIEKIVADWKKESDPSGLSAEEKEMQGISTERPYEMNITYFSSRNDSIFTHRFQVYSYNGGAHGIGVVQTINIGANEKEIAFEDLFIEAKQGVSALAALLKQKLYADFAERLYQNPEMVEEGLHGEALTSLPFEATPTGITFIFNQYQVGPYVSGTIEVPLSFSELSGIIKPDFLK